MEKLSEFQGEKENYLEEFPGEMLEKMSFKISWSIIKFPGEMMGEIPPAFLQEILQLIMEKNEKWLF